MILTDVNVLLEALMPASERHDTSVKFLLAMLNGEDNFGWHSSILSSVVRIATSPGVFTHPAPLEVAFAFCRAITEAPLAVLVEIKATHWDVYERLMLQYQIRGRHSTDAYFAAMAIDDDATWVTWDQDFRRFEGLNVKSPEEVLAELGL